MAIRTKAEKGGTNRKFEMLRRSPAVIAGFVAFLAAIAVIATFVITYIMEKEEPEPSGTIVAPAAGADASHEEKALGTIRDIPAENIAWVITEVVGPEGHVYYEKFKSQSANHLWPGPEPVKRLADDRWEAGVPLGSRSNPESIGLHFRITLVVVDAAINERFRQYNAAAPEQGFKGITPIPADGFKRLAEVVVVLAPGSP